MLDHVVALADAQGVDRSRLVCFHADLGRVEWPGTAELAEEHAAAYGLRIITIARPQGDLLDHIEARGMFPSAHRPVLHLGPQAWPGPQGHDHAGPGAGPAQGPSGPRPQLHGPAGPGERPPGPQARPFEYDARAGKGTVREVWTWLPILDWTVEQVWARIAEAPTDGAPGVRRGHAPPVLLLLRAGRQGRPGARRPVDPDLAAEYAAVEVRIGHIFRGKPGTPGALSMADIIAAGRGDGRERPAEILDWVA